MTMQYDVSMTNTKKEPPRTTHSLRLEDVIAEEIGLVADRDGLSWSEAARRLLKYAVPRMPAGWHR